MTTPLDIRSAYEVLGLPDGASLDEVQAAYRELAQILHPDRYASNGHLRDRAQEQFKRVNVARDVLVDYLRTGRRPRSTAGSGSGSFGVEPSAARLRAKGDSPCSTSTRCC